MIKNARESQKNRYKSNVIYNGSLTSSQVHKLLTITDDAKQLLSAASERLGLSARSYFKIIKVAQTIADMEGSSIIAKEYIADALQYRGQTSWKVACYLIR